LKTEHCTQLAVKDNRTHAEDIATQRLCLRAMPAEFLEACLRPETGDAQGMIGLRVPGDWLGQSGLISLRLAEFRGNPPYAPWGLRAIGLASNATMIGHIGFHSLPDPDYLKVHWPNAIELAYTVYPGYRRRGFAYEAAVAMFQWAVARAQIRGFVLSVSSRNVASRALAVKLGFSRVGEQPGEQGTREYVYVLDGEAMAAVLAPRGKLAGWAHQGASG
jgi:[ribosomal protein S5]-alanine N-acetyltransferase